MSPGGARQAARAGTGRRWRERAAALWGAGAVAVLAGVIFLPGLGAPAGLIWDEAYYVPAVARYEEQRTQLASHPPLGLLLLTAGDELMGQNRRINIAGIAGQKRMDAWELPRGYRFGGVRLAAAVFALVGAVLFFVLMRQLTGSTQQAVLLSSLYVLENAFIVQFRTAQLDAFQVCFVVAALVCLVAAVQGGERRTLWPDLGFAVALGLATMVKANAGVLAAAEGLLILPPLTGAGPIPAAIRAGALRRGLVVAGGFALTVVAVFAAHLAVAHRPPQPGTTAGAIDAAFLSGPVRAYLHGERGLSGAVLLSEIWDYGRFMLASLAALQGLRGGLAGSWAVLWPANVGAITYRADALAAGKTAYLVLAGNPCSAAVALGALIGALVLLKRPRPAAAGPAPPWRERLMQILVLQYGLYMIVHGCLGTMRVMYFYHYFIALILCFALIPLVLQEAAQRDPRLARWQERIVALIACAVVVGFVLLAPLTYHSPLTHAQCQWRRWLQTRLVCR